MTSTDQQTKVRVRQPKREAEQHGHDQLRQGLAELRQKTRIHGVAPDQLLGDELSIHVRFRDPATGKTWNGFGRPPNWIRGQDRSRFRIGVD